MNKEYGVLPLHEVEKISGVIGCVHGTAQEAWHCAERCNSGHTEHFRDDLLKAKRPHVCVLMSSLPDSGDQKSAHEAKRAEQKAEKTAYLCNGSCDIALARRQVGPNGLVPGNARECAEAWEREAHRLNVALTGAQAEERENARTIREQIAKLATAEAALRDERQAHGLTAKSCADLDVCNDDLRGTLDKIRSALGVDRFDGASRGSLGGVTSARSALPETAAPGGERFVAVTGDIGAALGCRFAPFHDDNLPGPSRTQRALDAARELNSGSLGRPELAWTTDPRRWSGVAVIDTADPTGSAPEPAKVREPACPACRGNGLREDGDSCRRCGGAGTVHPASVAATHLPTIAWALVDASGTILAMTPEPKLAAIWRDDYPQRVRALVFAETP
jgi:hypothetical protein